MSNTFKSYLTSVGEIQSNFSAARFLFLKETANLFSFPLPESFQKLFSRVE